MEVQRILGLVSSKINPEDWYGEPWCCSSEPGAIPYIGFGILPERITGRFKGQTLLYVFWDSGIDIWIPNVMHQHTLSNIEGTYKIKLQQEERNLLRDVFNRFLADN